MLAERPCIAGVLIVLKLRLDLFVTDFNIAVLAVKLGAVKESDRILGSIGIDGILTVVVIVTRILVEALVDSRVGNLQRLNGRRFDRYLE